MENEGISPDSRSVPDEDTIAMSGNSNYREGQDKIHLYTAGLQSSGGSNNCHNFKVLMSVSDASRYATVMRYETICYFYS